MPPINGSDSVDNTVYDVIVIGGGFAGSFTALELLKKGYKVLHIDKDSSILGSSSSSYNECYKLHTGIHYLGDLETARQCLLGAIEFAKEFREFIQGNPGDPWRKGRHYIVSNSLFEAKELCGNLQKLYEEKVIEDSDNAVFGDPKEFIKYLSPEEYSYVASEIPYTNEGYTFEVMYDIVPENNFLKPNKLYLYLQENCLKFKVFNKGIVEEFCIDETDPELDSIKAVLASRLKNNSDEDNDYPVPPVISIAELENKLEIKRKNLIYQGEKELTLEQKKILYKYTSKFNMAFSENGEVESIHVTLGIETPESQIDIKKLKVYLEKELASYPSYTFVPNSEVNLIAFEKSTLNYSVEAKLLHGQPNKKNTYKGAGVVNCTWHNMEALDREIGYVAQDESTLILPSGQKEVIKNERFIRIKISLLVELPEVLKSINTCIFSCGPHMSFTNLGDGTAVITYEPVTNAGAYLAGTTILNEKLQALYREKLIPDAGMGKDFAQKIMEGAARYLPDLKNPNCIVKEVRLGHVKIFVKDGKNFSLNDKDSAIHDRKETGVEEKGLCYLSHSGMKMTYTKKGAEIIASKFEDHFYTRKKILERARKALKPIQAITDYFSKKNVSDFYNLILFNIFRNLVIQTTEKIVIETFNMRNHPSMLSSEIDKIDKSTKQTLTREIQLRTGLVEQIENMTSKAREEMEYCIKPSKVKSLVLF